MQLFSTLGDHNFILHVLSVSKIVTRYGQMRPKQTFCKIELLILSLSTQFQDQFGPNPIFLPYSVTKLLNICVVYFLMYFYVFYSLFSPVSEFHICQLWPSWTISTQLLNSCITFHKSKLSKSIFLLFINVHCVLEFTNLVIIQNFTKGRR